jgi:uncharacterized membrane protein HdeD (DUF308 family)
MVFQAARQDAGAMLTRVGKHWGWFLAFGILTVALGVAVLIWPGHTLVAVAVLIGVQLIIAGIFRFVAAFAFDLSGGTRVLLAVLGVFSLIIGLYAVRHILITLLALTLVLGIFWIVNGVVEVFTALSHKELANRGWTGFMGALSIVAGIIVLLWPALTLLALAIVIGVWLLIFGFMEITLAFRVRTAGKVGRSMAHAA